MRKFFMIAVMAVAALSANAQRIDPEEANAQGKFHVTPMAGFGYDGLQGEDNCASGLGALVRGEVEYMVAKNFGLGAGLEFEARRSDSYKTETTIGSSKQSYELYQTNEFLNIPVLAQYHFGGFAIKAGVQPGFMIENKAHATATSGSVEVKDKENLKDYSNAFQCAIPVGLSYTFRVPVTIDLRCAIPLTKVYKESRMKQLDENIGNKNAHHLSVMLTVGYRFFR